MSWVDLRSGRLHAQPSPNWHTEGEREHWGHALDWPERLQLHADGMRQSGTGYLEIVPACTPGQWWVRTADYYDGERFEYVGFFDDGCLKTFESWQEARDRMRAVGFPFANMRVMIPAAKADGWLS